MGGSYRRLGDADRAITAISEKDRLGGDLHRGPESVGDGDGGGGGYHASAGLASDCLSDGVRIGRKVDADSFVDAG